MSSLAPELQYKYMFRNDEINMGMQGCRKLRKKDMMDIKDKGYIKRESMKNVLELSGVFSPHTQMQATI